MFTKKTRLFVMLGIMAVAIAFLIVGALVLPGTMVVQLNAEGAAGNTLAKPLALALPLLMCLIFSALYYQNGEPKNLFVAVLGVAVSILLFIFNL